MMATAIALDPDETLTVGDVVIGLWEHRRVLKNWANHLDLLDDRERRRLAELSSPQRATAFVAGRCCARSMLSRHFSATTPPSGWRIDTGRDGRPSLHGHLSQGNAISISHTDSLSAAALRAGPVGIDIEPLYRTIAADVAEIGNAVTPIARLSAWTATEARFKLDGTPMGNGDAVSVTTTHIVHRLFLIAIATAPSLHPKRSGSGAQNAFEMAT